MINFIKESFASLKSGRYIGIKQMTRTVDAWVFRKSESYGVAIPYDGETIYEKFSNVIMRSEEMSLDGAIRRVLTLTCSIEELRNEFAVIAMEFVDVGENNSNRFEVSNRPREWWSRWSSLIGNAFVEKNSYDVLAEMLVLEYLLEKFENPTWRGPFGGSQDIITDRGPVEVKSTIRKYSAIVSINSQFQLNQNENNMRLFFVRMEKNNNGISIESIYNRLIKKGIDFIMIKDNLNKSGIIEGSGLWKEKFEVLEKRMYIVDKKFPIINRNSFINNKIPDGIIKLIYEIDLDSLKYELW